jgi:hypothetical protein
MLNIGLKFRQESIAIVDVGPGFVRAALISLQDGTAHVTASAISLISVESETPEHSIAAIGERLDEALKRLMSRGEQKGVSGRINSVYCFVHAPWSHSMTVRKRVDYQVETKIHESHISALAKELLGEAKDIDMNNMMEAAVIRTWLNGYPVEKPEGRSAHSLVVCAIVSDIDPSVKKNAEAAMHRAFPSSNIQWRSAAHAMQQTLGSVYRDDENYLAVDMGMDATHLISVRDGFPIGERVVKEGLRTILTRIDPKRVAEETLGMIRMLSRDACEGSACEAIQKAMAIAEPELAKIYGEAFGGLAQGRRLANTLVLSANPDLVDWMRQFFSRLDFTQFTATTLPFTVIPCDRAVIGSRVQSDEELHPALVFAAALVNMEHQA